MMQDTLPISTVRVQVVIVTYNRADCLRTGLAALQRQTHPIERIWVINNNCTDHTADVLQQAQDMGLPVVVEQMARNMGGAGGFARGLELARTYTTDWVWVMDDDVEPAPNCLAQLIAASDRYDMLQANRYQPDQGFMTEVAEMNFRIPWERLIQRIVQIDDASDQRVLDIAVATFEGAIIRHHHVVKLDLPQAEFFICGDDWDYSLRLGHRGGRIGLCGAAHLRRMLPFKSWSPSNELTWKDYFSNRNLCWLEARHGGRLFGWIRTNLRALRMLAHCIIHRKSLNSYRITGLVWLDGLSGRARNPEWLLARFK
ncbi:MAG: glycosyltransferase [Alphaproteobacteria bacterium]|nr:glycosyltransferase [Alphaproteobacteria bacterium]